jgi:hypothetical protein
MATKTKNSATSTQNLLAFREIKGDTLVLKNGTYISIIAVSSTNFALKNQDEQNGLIYGYQNFLNSLDFEIQILMQSRVMDVGSYINQLHKMMEQQTNELLRVQTSEYIEFIGKLIENASIMSKTFYVIVPYGAAVSSKTGSMLGRKADADKVTVDVNQQFQDNKVKLDQRTQTVMTGLNGLGLRSAQLKTEEMIELLYNSYNFGAGQMLDASKLNDINIQS